MHPADECFVVKVISFRNETIEQTEFGAYAMRKRVLKKQNDRQGDAGRANPDLYHGSRAKFHYFQCLQLLLRMQVRALCLEWNLLLKEFEVICRDLWALHVSLLPNPPPPEPYYHAQDTAQGDNMDKTTGSLNPRQVQPALNEEPDELLESGASESGLEGDNALPRQRILDSDPMLAALLREASESSSGGSRSSTPYQEDKAHRQKKKEVRNRYSKPAANISILMLACWQLRVPVTYMDFISLINQYRLPYLEPTHLLPSSLTKHLTETTLLALSPQHAPSAVVIHSLTSRLAKLIKQRYNIHTPEFNTAPVLWRAVRAFNGSALLYSLSKTIGGIVSLTLNVNRSLAPPLPRQKGYDPTYHIGDNAPPELSLIACVCLVLKMIYGLDGRDQLPKDTNDPASSFPPKGELLAELSSQCHIASTSLEMTDSDVDKYLNFCERVLPRRDDPEGAKTGFDTIARHFPIYQRIDQSENQESTDSADVPHSVFMPMGVLSQPPQDAARSSERQASLPGENHVIYNTNDILGAIPYDYETVLEAAGSWTGIGKEDVGGLVERYERRIIRWWEMIRRGEDSGKGGA
ncbi:hypothetical protein FRC02_005510 [Tulasnella sp. 418]|nr:hypothetical protein FRC02_005510 [Tulasnella sp. 418]